MFRPSLDQDIKPLSEFRSHASSFIDHIQKTKRPLVITQHGRSAAVLLNVSEYEALIDKLELLQEIAQAQADIEQGKTVSHEDAYRYVLERI